MVENQREIEYLPAGIFFTSNSSHVPTSELYSLLWHALRGRGEMGVYVQQRNLINQQYMLLFFVTEHLAMEFLLNP